MSQEDKSINTLKKKQQVLRNLYDLQDEYIGKKNDDIIDPLGNLIKVLEKQISEKINCII